jgi:hypothetical protein
LNGRRSGGNELETACEKKKGRKFEPGISEKVEQFAFSPLTVD